MHTLDIPEFHSRFDKYIVIYAGNEFDILLIFKIKGFFFTSLWEGHKFPRDLDGLRALGSIGMLRGIGYCENRP